LPAPAAATTVPWFHAGVFVIQRAHCFLFLVAPLAEHVARVSSEVGFQRFYINLMFKKMCSLQLW
jgi:hypothetical protein